ncbi:hypothetical protein HPB51_007496 [Rhipicephalus microplus]|uniref:Uncharacterized protein n=1 Tax=Rhipicephalus microplus TaxID=6941 RepID=A0A9J6DTP4_RHIMP|nr:hypothetical protein HPB51_007496 [Rhipicephalus microplus]
MNGKFDFAGRLVALPLVASLLIRASRLYEKAKNHSVFISVPMTAVETTVRKTVLVCRALLMPLLSRQLLYVEALASRVFHEVQERLTEAFFQPDEIIAYVILMVAQLMLCTITKYEQSLEIMLTEPSDSVPAPESMTDIVTYIEQRTQSTNPVNTSSVTVQIVFVRIMNAVK